MKVYLLFSRVQYEGSMLCGIFATRELADEALSRCNTDRYVGYEYFEVVEANVRDSLEGFELGYIS